MANRAEQTYGGGSCRWGIQFLKSLCSWAASQFKQFSKLQNFLVATSSLIGASRSLAAAMVMLRRTSNKLWQISRYMPPESPQILFRAIVKMKRCCAKPTSPVFKSIIIMIMSNNTQQCAPRQQCCKPMACGCGEPLRNSCKMPINRKTYEVH